MELGDRRHGERLERVDGLCLEVSGRGTFPAGDRREVVTRAERSPGTAQHDDRDIARVGKIVEMATEFDEELRCQRIELVGSIEGQRGDVVVVGPVHERFGHGRGRLLVVVALP